MKRREGNLGARKWVTAVPTRGRNTPSLWRHYGQAIEITFRECKQIVGAGQQQVRFIWANVGAFHVCLWTVSV